MEVKPRYDLPSYEESIAKGTSDASHQGFDGEDHHSLQLLNQITTSRSAHIRSVIDQYVLPRVQKEAGLGISTTSIVLIPSDARKSTAEKETEGLFDNEKKYRMDGAPPEDETQIYLQGPMNRLAFWEQNGVIDELKTTLEIRLGSTFRGKEPSTDSGIPKAKKGFFANFGHLKPRVPAPLVVEYTTKFGRVDVEVCLDAFSLRVMNPFGLHDFVETRAIVISVAVQCL